MSGIMLSPWPHGATFLEYVGIEIRTYKQKKEKGKAKLNTNTTGQVEKENKVRQSRKAPSCCSTIILQIILSHRQLNTC